MQSMKATGIKIGDVEVLEIDESKKNMALGVKVNCQSNDILSFSSKLETREKIDAIYKYLVAEGFIINIPIHRWHINVFAAPKL